MLPLELIIRALSIVFGLVAFVLAIMVGGFVFVVIGTFLFLVAITVSYTHLTLPTKA